jgi:hypothetical protein
MTKTAFAGAAGCLALAVQLQAQTLPVGSHYPIGAEGIKGPDLPPPGFYVRDYNYFYTADKVDGLPVNLNLYAYVQAPKLIWMSPWKIFGANWGGDMIIPFAYKDLNSPFGSGSQFNLGDVYASPLLLGWHFKQFAIGAAYGIWAPSGEFDASSKLNYLTSPGSGYWSHMLTLGATWYPDEAKTWSVSLLNRYEVSTEQDQTHITPGNMQTTQDSGPDAATVLSNVAGIGPEVSVTWEKIGLITSLRYIYEAEARDHSQGHAIVLTLTKRF